MRKNSDNFSMQDAMRMAQSPEGQQLLSLLRSGNSETLTTAMNQAASGDYEQVKNTLSTLLESAQVRELLEKMRGNENG